MSGFPSIFLLTLHAVARSLTLSQLLEVTMPHKGLGRQELTAAESAQVLQVLLRGERQVAELQRPTALSSFSFASAPRCRGLQGQALGRHEPRGAAACAEDQGAQGLR